MEKKTLSLNFSGYFMLVKYIVRTRTSLILGLFNDDVSTTHVLSGVRLSVTGKFSCIFVELVTKLCCIRGLTGVTEKDHRNPQLHCEISGSHGGEYEV
jgi:hypothetical protein